MVSIKKIVFDIGGKESGGRKTLELSLEDAIALHRELSRYFGDGVYNNSSTEMGYFATVGCTAGSKNSVSGVD